ncbi:T9SS type A sorting domain-containing protein [uncultured Fibrella sp.]|uniref:T9SS type A sorting domain-containing protein n=1 Tax=uncultured Fibrella sp. TaxID=1284596 RepID=UPI0035CAAA49
MKIILITSLVSLVTCAGFGQTTLFQQDFSAGGVLSDYVNSSNPGSTKFKGISGPSASILNGALQFDRPNNGSTGHFAHNTDFNPTPGSLYIQFDFEVVSATTIAGNSVLLFYVGNSFSNGPGNPSNADIYARFGINFTGNGHEFSVRSIPSGGGGANSVAFTGKQTLTFVLNNADYTVTYLQPGGGLKTLPNDTYDLWVGTTRVFTDLPVLTPTQTMTDFKLRIDDDVYAAIFQFDNFLIRDINGALPVATTLLKAQATGTQVNLNWQSVNQLATLFTVERSTNAQEFTAIGIIQATDDPAKQRTYDFIDAQPAEGINYYRLRQTNTDGSVVLSKIATADVPTSVPGFTILDNPGAGTFIRLLARNLTGATYLISTLAGHPVSCQQRETPEGEITLLLQHPLPSGVYLLTASTGTARLTKRVLVQ